MNDIKKTTDTNWPQTVKMPKYTCDQTGTENNHKTIKMGHNMSTKTHKTATKAHEETKQPEAVVLHGYALGPFVLLSIYFHISHLTKPWHQSERNRIEQFVFCNFCQESNCLGNYKAAGSGNTHLTFLSNHSFGSCSSVTHFDCQKIFEQKDKNIYLCLSPANWKTRSQAKLSSDLLVKQKEYCFSLSLWVS